ncbi:hypothetical protein SKAU_G00058710 [Synaphobranchus kaupii]|uniref:Uncharacterized protein n=1 Tax=Synaphobranchus kaupii TaxID=118154 RepID=A0A9Q1G5A6_SYNKA|nr:hypothetical protein SKAU_G00058710 [Synaphobranchus kaupii]
MYRLERLGRAEVSGRGPGCRAAKLQRRNRGCYIGLNTSFAPGGERGCGALSPHTMLPDGGPVNGHADNRAQSSLALCYRSREAGGTRSRYARVATASTRSPASIEEQTAHPQGN